MSARWPGWEDHPGLEIAPIAEHAAAQFERYTIVRIVAGPDGAKGRADCFGIKVDAAGNCSVPGNEQWWDVMTEDGKITGVKAIGRDPEEYPPWRLIRVPMIAIPAAHPAPVLHAYVPETIPLDEPVTGPAAVADCCCDAGSGTAALSILVATSEDSSTAAMWHLTSDSALALIAAMTAQHGPPVSEWMGTAEDQDFIRDAADGHGVLVLHGENGIEGDKA
jgi:hypothetical protein